MYFPKLALYERLSVPQKIRFKIKLLALSGANFHLMWKALRFYESGFHKASKNLSRYTGLNKCEKYLLSSVGASYKIFINFERTQI